MADEPIYLAQQTDLDNHVNATGNVHGMVKGDIGLGNVDNTADANKSVKHATTAGSLATARTITLSGDVSGSVSFNGSKDVTITTTVADDSHNHTIANVDGLQTALDGKETSGAAATALTNAKSYTDANKYTHPSYTAKSSGFYKVTVDSSGHVSGATAVSKADITGLGIPAQDTTYGEATTDTAGLMSADDKEKLDGIATGANKYSHPTYTAKSSGFYKVTVDGTGHVSGATAVTKADITGLGIPAQDTTYSAATQSANGLMSSSDKKKLDGIAAGANAYTHPSYTAKSSGFYKVTVDATGHVSAATTVTKADITGLGIPAQDTTYSAATTSTAGLMSAADKTKLNATNVAWGTCSTEAATAAKVITISGNTNWALTAGAIIAVKFSATNTASNPTFNVNGTGAKSVWYGTAVLTTSSLSYAGYKDRPCFYVYDGTQFVFLGWSYDANTTYTNVKLGHGYATCSTAAATAAKVGTLSSYTLVTGGIVAVKFTYAVPANATLNINSKGAKAIYHRGAKITAGVINAGDTATFMYNGSYYHLLSVDSEPTNIATLQSKVSALETKVAELEALLAYIVGIDDTGVYVEEGV